MLMSHAESSSSSAQDIECTEGLQLPISLSDSMPAQKIYTAIPKYFEDLLNRGWIVKSRSNCASPVICVRKKDGSLKLCVDYRLLNSRTIQDRHPLLRVDDILQSLDGNHWLSLLDQGNAYHQGFVPTVVLPMPQWSSRDIWNTAWKELETSFVFRTLTIYLFSALISSHTYSICQQYYND